MRLRYIVVDLGNEVYRMEGLRQEACELPGDGWMSAPLDSPMWRSVLALAQGAASLPVGADGWDGRIRAYSRGRIEIEAWKE